MLIDWFTVGAQALNFLVLVWLMKRFLYQPVLHAIDAREQRIAAELADADKKRAEAELDRDELERQHTEFEQQRAALMRQATSEANAERQRLLDEARQAADTLSSHRQETLRDDARRLSGAMGRRIQEEVFAITRKVLGDLATTSLEERMGEVLTRRLRELDGAAKESLVEALAEATEPALVRSAFDLPAEQHTAIQKALDEAFADEITTRFETAPDLICGIELVIGGQKVSWSIAEYLMSLEKSVAKLVNEPAGAEAQA